MMKSAAAISAAMLLGALVSTGAEAGWRGYGYGYGPSTTTYTYSETRTGGGYRDVGFGDHDDDRPAYRTRRVVREVYEVAPRHRGYPLGGPHYRGVEFDDED